MNISPLIRFEIFFRAGSSVTLQFFSSKFAKFKMLCTLSRRFTEKTVFRSFHVWYTNSDTPSYSTLYMTGMWTLRVEPLMTVAICGTQCF